MKENRVKEGKRPTGSHKVASRSGAQVSPWAAGLASAVCAAAAYFAGDSVGYTRATQESASCVQADPMDRLDRMAERHQTRIRSRAAEASPAPQPASATSTQPEKLTFHDALKGAPRKPPPAPAPAATAKPASAPKAEVAHADAVKPEAPKAEAPKPSPALLSSPATDEFSLQAGAFPDKDDALKLYDRLKAQGLRPSIVPSESAGTTWYRVRVGRFSDRSAAEDGAKSLQQTAQLTAVVLKH